MEKTELKEILEVKRLLKIDKGAEHFLKKCFKDDLERIFGSILNISGCSSSGKSALAAELCSYFLKKDDECAFFTSDPSCVNQRLVNNEIKDNNLKVYGISSTVERTYDKVFSLIAELSNEGTKVIILDSMSDLVDSSALGGRNLITSGASHLQKISSTLANNKTFFIVTNRSQKGQVASFSSWASHSISTTICSLKDKPTITENRLSSSVFLIKSRFSDLNFHFDLDLIL